MTFPIYPQQLINSLQPCLPVTQHNYLHRFRLQTVSDKTPRTVNSLHAPSVTVAFHQRYGHGKRPRNWDIL